MTTFNLRRETPADYRAVEELTRDAFWNNHVPGCDEHWMLHAMRDCDAFLPELDFVAVEVEGDGDGSGNADKVGSNGNGGNELGGKLVGNIVYAVSKIAGDDGLTHDVITFGPLSVLPEYQSKGIGGALIRHTLELARQQGFKAVLIYGDPIYYSRFGFVPAETYDIRTSDDMYAEPLQALELQPGALAGVSGRFFEGEAYEVDEPAAVAFDTQFKEKEKLTGLPSQQRFIYLVNAQKPRS